MSENKNARGLERKNQGLTELEQYTGMKLPTDDWNITGVLGDIIMAKYVDCSDDGKLILRGGIYVDNDVSRYTWRVAEVILAGPGCSEQIKPGVNIIFPNNKGVPGVMIPGRGKARIPVIFLNEERIFGVCEPRKG